MLIEHHFGCPHCGEQISMLLELLEGGQDYIEDCEVCCSPIRVRLWARGGELTDFSAEPA